VRRLIVGVVLVGLTAPAGAQHTLRLATAPPDGTSWAHEIRAFQREVEEGTRGTVRVKLYFGGVAGDEHEELERVRNGQLNAFLGGVGCEEVMPTLRAMALPALFQSREEAAYVTRRLASDLEAEAHANGFEAVGMSGLGPAIIFSRNELATFEQLQKTKLWLWNVDTVSIASLRAMGLTVVPTRIELAAAAFDRGEVDGFDSIPVGALAFQWSARTPFILDLRMRYLEGCLLVAARTFDALTYEQRQVLREATARLDRRNEETGAREDAMLLGGAFGKQGARVVTPSAALRSEFFDSARRLRPRAAHEAGIPEALVARIQQILADYRAEHGSR
jgi:TRAP-type C4-dicarboxylate transport system substrate-binding protein